MHLPQLIQDLAIILGVAAIVTFLFRLTKQPVVLGYIVAGIIVGPYTPPILSVVEVDSVKVWAELGVIFLMFALGLEFSFRRLAKVGPSAGVAGILQIITMVIGGYLCARFLNWSKIDGIFLGCMIAISSTTIIIKTLDELGMKTKKFTELVFGILIVEDLAAIIMLVALSNIATKASVDSMDLFFAGTKMLLVVGIWLVVGIFLVPRFIKAVSQRGNNEMMLVFSLALCLALVTLSAYFHYSVALGAFVMGSILAETKEVHRIEGLMSPLKDLFGAIFFVSVGMLLEPNVIIENWQAVLLICIVIIIGKIISVSIGALFTGQTLSTSVYTGLSMAQIGEFSFIIATLGLTYEAIDEKLYPIIVAASLITTFTTPYFVRLAPSLTSFLERHLPPVLKVTLDRYGSWFQKRTLSRKLSRDFYIALLRWLANMLVVIALFIISANQLIPQIRAYFPYGIVARGSAWLLTFLVSSPFIWAMFTSFKDKNSQIKFRNLQELKSIPPSYILSRFATILMIGVLSIEFFSFWVSILLMVSVSGLFFFIFRRQIENYYHWFENKFVSGIDQSDSNAEKKSRRHDHLVPWDAHLAEIPISPGSRFIGKTIQGVQLRERFGVNIVVIKRGSEDLVAPSASETLYPGDILLCFGTDEELEKAKKEIEQIKPSPSTVQGELEYGLRPVEILDQSYLVNKTIRESGIRESFDCMVVGIEREGRRIQSPTSSWVMQSRDLLWVVGELNNINKLHDHILMHREQSAR